MAQKSGECGKGGGEIDEEKFARDIGTCDLSIVKRNEEICMNGFDILNEFSNEELEVLVKLILDKGEFTEMLSEDERYKTYKPDHKRYVNKIKSELSEFASNSFVTAFRGHGVSYREMLTDVCEKTKTSFDENASLERIENALLEKVLEDAWENLSEQQKKEVLENTPIGNMGGFAVGAMLAAFRAGGAVSYQLTMLIVNGIAKAILGRMLVGAVFARGAIGLLGGPIGIVLGSFAVLFDVSGPAYRITVPATIYIAALRRVHQSEQYKEFAFA